VDLPGPTVHEHAFDALAPGVAKDEAPDRHQDQLECLVLEVGLDPKPTLFVAGQEAPEPIPEPGFGLLPRQRAGRRRVQGRVDRVSASPCRP